MSDKDSLQVPETNWQDRILSLAKIGMSAVPFVGSPVVEAMNAFITPSLEARKQVWCEMVIRRLEQTPDAEKVFAELQTNQEFIDTLLQASATAIRTSQNEKLNALRNAVINSASQDSPELSHKQLFLRYVEELTVWHIHVLNMLTYPNAWFAKVNRKIPHNFNTVHLDQSIIAAFPELEESLRKQIVLDLSNSGLIQQVQ